MWLHLRIGIWPLPRRLRGRVIILFRPRVGGRETRLRLIYDDVNIRNGLSGGSSMAAFGRFLAVYQGRK